MVRGHELLAAQELDLTLVSEYCGEAAGRPLATGMVPSHQTFG